MSSLQEGERNALEPAGDEGRSSLQGLAPKAKARRFRALLPVIEARIEAGVRHADIIRALSDQGLALRENTYFTYLRRFRRKQAAAQRQGAQAAARSPNSALPACTGELPTSSSQSGDNAARRPPTFDYDPRGIPHLLK
ncbi:MAG TPA: hypothetical protein VGQ19_17970 [Burkholderiales bacterium]|nr:hypothetical protein [Burkholderiales bacterium]